MGNFICTAYFYFETKTKIKKELGCHGEATPTIPGAHARQAGIALAGEQRRRWGRGATQICIPGLPLGRLGTWPAHLLPSRVRVQLDHNMGIIVTARGAL